jgi:hypothetical protein
MVRSRAKRRLGSKQMAPEQGDGWLARVVRAENTMAEKVDQLEGKQKRAHEHDASISLEITRTDGDGFPGRASVHAWQPLPRTLSRRSSLSHRVRHLSNLFCASDQTLDHSITSHPVGSYCRGSTYRLRDVCLGFWVPGAPHLDAYRPRLDTRGLQVAPRLTRRILPEAKHPALSTQLSFAVANARRKSQFAMQQGSASSPGTCTIRRKRITSILTFEC